ncbi:MAG TPA: DNA repair and recombination protein RadB [archaeon]|nr:DNA repair and recombination protein RadB [archaeon]
MRLATNTPLDKLLDGGIETDAITNIYGPPGSGKTNIMLSTTLSCIRSGKKVVYMDTEGSFSFDRFEQMGGTEKDLKSIVFVNVHEWDEQHRDVQKIDKVIDGVGLVIIDSMVALYRLVMEEKNFQSINKQLATQYSILSRITRTKHIPILITNQVYSRGEVIELTSRTIARYWSKTLVELKRTEKENQRIAVIRKHRSLPEGRSIEFLITKDGLKQVGRFSIL